MPSEWLSTASLATFTPVAAEALQRLAAITQASGTE
jgi:hypothetical protein